MLPKPASRSFDLKASRKDKRARRRTMALLVWERDGYKCRACGQRLSTTAVDPLQRGHVHHLKFRSKGGPDEVSNGVLLCAIDHDHVHGYRLSIGGKPNGALTFSMEGRTPWVSWPASSAAIKR